MAEVKKEYTNGEITIVWKPAKCIHAGTCVRKLPQVYNPKARPWITIENATTAQLEEQVQACPSGALSFYRNDEVSKPADDMDTTNAHITVLKNGPLLIKGTVDITLKNGEQQQKTESTAFCRCGASANKPFCDGAHVRISFTDE